MRFIHQDAAARHDRGPWESNACHVEVASGRQRAEQSTYNTTIMLRTLLLAPLLVAAVSAAQLAVQNARLTIDSAEGSQLVSETYVSKSQLQDASRP